MPVMKGPAHAGPFHVSTLRCGPDRPARTAAGGTLDGPIRQRRIRSAYASWHGEHGEGEPLALLHPGGADARAWAPNLDAAAARLHVFTPERRGHGPTPDVEGPITYELIVQDTIEFLERVVGGPAHLVGRSAGASVALLAALRRPDLARRLVLIAGVFHRDAGRSSQVARQATVGDLRSLPSCEPRPELVP